MFVLKCVIFRFITAFIDEMNLKLKRLKIILLFTFHSLEVPTIKSSIVLSETTEIYPLGEYLPFIIY